MQNPPTIFFGNVTERRAFIVDFEFRRTTPDIIKPPLQEAQFVSGVRSQKVLPPKPGLFYAKANLVQPRDSKLPEVVGVKHSHKTHGLSLLLELLCHFQRQRASHAIACEKVWSLRLETPYIVDILSCHLFDGGK